MGGNVLSRKDAVITTRQERGTYCFILDRGKRTAGRAFLCFVSGEATGRAKPHFHVQCMASSTHPRNFVNTTALAASAWLFPGSNSFRIRTQRYYHHMNHKSDSWNVLGHREDRFSRLLLSTALSLWAVHVTMGYEDLAVRLSPDRMIVFVLALGRQAYKYIYRRLRHISR